MRYYLLKIVVVCFLVLAPFFAHAEDHFSASIITYDPPSSVELDAYDKLYLHIHYESDASVRFQVVPLRNGLEVEFGAMSSSTMLWPKDNNEALTWLSFSSTTHIDEVRIVVLGADWHKVGEFSAKIEMLWNSTLVENPREPAEWVKKLIRKNRLRQEFAFDPNPQKKQVVYDAFFYASVFTIPFYLILQLQFLRLWRGRWRELAAIPIISITPLIFMAILGLGIELRLWIIFIFRGMPLALIYLCALWFARRMSLRKQAESADS